MTLKDALFSSLNEVVDRCASGLAANHTTAGKGSRAARLYYESHVSVPYVF